MGDGCGKDKRGSPFKLWTLNPEGTLANSESTFFSH